MSECNGWRNRETWLVNVHGFFDEDYFEENKFANASQAADAMSDSFDEWFADEIKSMHPFLQDCLNTNAIDWFALAEAHEEQWKIVEADEDEAEGEDG